MQFEFRVGKSVDRQPSTHEEHSREAGRCRAAGRGARVRRTRRTTAGGRQSVAGWPQPMDILVGAALPL